MLVFRIFNYLSEISMEITLLSMLLSSFGCIKMSNLPFEISINHELSWIFGACLKILSGTGILAFANEVNYQNLWYEK